MKIRHLISSILLFCCILVTSLLFGWKQNLLPYANTIVLVGVLYMLDKFIIKPNYIACISNILLIVVGFIVDIILNGNIKLYFASFLHILVIPFIFLIYYFHNEKKRLYFNFSLFLLFCILATNFFFRDKIIEYDNYGTHSDLLEKNVVVQNLEVLGKNGRDTVFNFDNRVYLIDIWGLYCPMCYSDMVFLDSLKKSDSSIQLISLLTYRKHDSLKSIKKINELDNSYPSYLLKDTNLLKHLEIEKVPSYLILQNNKIVYRNSLEKVLNRYYELRKL